MRFGLWEHQLPLMPIPNPDRKGAGMGLWLTKGDEDARGARTAACRVHTPVNAVTIVLQPCVRKSANAARTSACATGLFSGVGAVVFEQPRSLLCIR